LRQRANHLLSLWNGSPVTALGNRHPWIFAAAKSSDLFFEVLIPDLFVFSMVKRMMINSKKASKGYRSP
jgi:hypothetical protein